MLTLPRSWLALAAALAVTAGCAPKAPPPAHHTRETWPPPPSAAPAHKTFAELAPVDAAPLRTKWTPEEIAFGCDAAEKSADARLSDLVNLSDTKRTFANSFGALEQITTDYTGTVWRLTFMKSIHPDEKVRAAASACEERAGKYGVELSARKDLYLAMKGYLDHAARAEVLDRQDGALVHYTMRDFRRSGLELSDENRAELVKLRSRLAELQTRFATALEEDKSSITATLKELDGLPADFVKRLARAKDGKRVITTAYPDYYPVMENAKSAVLRRRMQVAFGNRGMPGNPALENEAVQLRAKAAKLLGYPTHADFVTEVNMARSAKTVADFEAKLREALKPRLAADTRKMEALKSKDTRGKDVKIHSWDWRYYLNQLKKAEYALDDEKVRAYFPADVVMKGMFEVYQTLLSVDFKEAPVEAPWADGVKLYEIHDRPGGRLLAKFYVDLYPRPGKYGHAACFDVGAARELPAGYQIPLSALVVNFNPPANGQGARLSIAEVDTLFHEFGHVMHMSLTTARYASLAGANVPRDFVEAPSQMLENWVFEPAVLKLISRDPADPTKTLPEDLVKKVVAARTFDSGVKYTRQVFLGTFDQYIHTRDQVDADAEGRRLWLELMDFPEDPEEHFAASFGHPMGGYDAGYYGYLWSLVFAADMYERFTKDGVLNPQTGRAYRDAILAKGRTEAPDRLLREFLGREPNEEAFLRLSGIKQNP
ncbi:MAG: M3 family metallopeptidase [Myxococcaceae bacterium]